jgi:hypothetical protein
MSQCEVWRGSCTWQHGFDGRIIGTKDASACEAAEHMVQRFVDHVSFGDRFKLAQACQSIMIDIVLQVTAGGVKSAHVGPYADGLTSKKSAALLESAD